VDIDIVTAGHDPADVAARGTRAAAAIAEIGDNAPVGLLGKLDDADEDPDKRQSEQAGSYPVRPGTLRRGRQPPPCRERLGRARAAGGRRDGHVHELSSRESCSSVTTPSDSPCSIGRPGAVRIARLCQALACLVRPRSTTVSARMWPMTAQPAMCYEHRSITLVRYKKRAVGQRQVGPIRRSEEHTSELQSR